MTSELYKQLNSNIKTLSKDDLIVFGAEICKQLLSDYKAFEEKHKWGNYLLLEETLTKITKKELRHSDLKPLTNKIKEVIPDTEDFGDFISSYALNAAASVLELIEYLFDNNKGHIINISGYATDSVDFKLQENNPGIPDKELENHPLLIAELNKQLSLTKSKFN
ncbi:MAG: DUF416 family protein [Sphingobacteriaceae bacterium]|nr:DUF416 family protein [Sphingobacteriaceae bacterium]